MWRGGNTSDSINVVTLHQAQVVPGLVIVFGQVNQPGTEPGTQVDSAWAVPLCLFKGRGTGDLWTGALEMYWLTN